MDRSDLTRIDDYQWELPAAHDEAMRVPVRLFATEALAERLVQSEAMAQAVRVASLPGLVGHLIVMPDAYAGQGAPFGMVAAMKHPVGMVVPGAIGQDVGCGVRLLGSKVKAEDVEDRLDALADALQERIPTGANAEGALSLNKSEVDHIAKSGAQWALRRDMAVQDDLVRTEEGGRLNDADPAKVSDEARALGARQLGTLGGGEHFVEIGVVDEVMNLAAGITMGLKKGTLVAQIHSGSRGYGRQVCTDYIRRFQKAAGGTDNWPDPDLAAVSLEETGAKDYTGAMCAAANFAYANRQVLAHRVREAFAEVFGEGSDLHTVYDVAHNLGQIEMHEVDGRHIRCYVHRKGAARAFGPGTPGISLPYRAIGQPVLVPGQMGQASWVLLSTLYAMQKSFGSACHGAGRTMSVHDAGHDGGAAVPEHELRAQGVRVRSGGNGATAASEAPAGEATNVREQEAVDAVVEAVAGARLASKVARLKPVAVIHA